MIYSKNAEIKEHNTFFGLAPKYNKECSELLFYFPSTLISGITFINYFISNHGKPTTNYKSIHFTMNKKELNGQEIKNYIVSDPNNEIMNLCQNEKELFNKHNYIRVVLNNPIDRIFNFPETFLSHVIKTSKEIKHLL